MTPEQRKEREDERERERAAIVARVKRRMARAIDPELVELSLPEAAAYIGLSRAAGHRRLMGMHAESGGLLLSDRRRKGATRPHWKTTPRRIQRWLEHARRDELELAGDLEERVDGHERRIARLERITELVVERITENEPTS